MRVALILIAVLAGGLGLAACHGGEHPAVEQSRPGEKGNGGGGY